MSRSVLLVLVVAGSLAVGVAAGITHAAFSSVADTASNSFTADTSFEALRMATGTYTGNGINARAITAPGFKPDVVMVKASTAQIGVMRTASMTGDATKLLSGSTAVATDHIESLDNTGFTLGTNARVNSSGVTYQWVALKGGTSGLRVGSYTGNGAASRAITGVGFSPSFVTVMAATAQPALLRMTGMTRAYQYDTGTGSTAQITSLDADGFTVANNAATNTSGTVYYYLALADAAGTQRVSTYTGNNTAGRAITGTGFQPQFVLVRANDTATSRAGRMRPASLTGLLSQGFNALADISTSITALQSNGFQVGTDASVNANAIAYYYLALRDMGA